MSRSWDSGFEVAGSKKAQTNDINVSPNYLVCKVIGIMTESGKFWFVQSGIHKSLASIARNLRLWNP